MEDKIYAIERVKKAANDVLNKAGDSCDPNVNDIKKKLAKLKDLWNQIQKTANDQGQSVEEALVAVDLHAVTNALKELQDSLAAQETPAIEPILQTYTGLYQPPPNCIRLSHFVPAYAGHRPYSAIQLLQETFQGIGQRGCPPTLCERLSENLPTQSSQKMSLHQAHYSGTETVSSNPTVPHQTPQPLQQIQHEHPAPDSSHLQPIQSDGILLTSRHLNKLAESIGSDWKSVGRDLDIEDKELERIKKDYCDDGPTEMAYQMLCAWRDKLQKNSTVDQLAKTFEEVKRPGLASEILQISGKTATVRRNPGIVEMSQEKTRTQSSQAEVNSYSEILKGDHNIFSAPFNVGGIQKVKHKTIVNHPEPDLERHLG